LDKQLTSEDVVAGNLILVQKGKKNYYLVRVI
jgi:ribosomal protein L27